MAKSANQKGKLLHLLQILAQTDEAHPVTMQEILMELSRRQIHAERKSVYDDIAVLREFGYDIETRPGRHYSYYMASRPFELPELKLLVDAVQASRFITHKKTGELIQKLEGLASKYEARQLQHQVFVTNRIKTMNHSVYYNIDTIHQAIQQDCCIRMKYFEWVLDWSAPEKVTKRFRRNGGDYAVSPWALIWDNENYYLVAFDEHTREVRHYRVDKMQDIRITDGKRQGKSAFERFDTALYSQMLFGMFAGAQEQVTLRFENRLVGVVTERFGRELILVPDGTDHFSVTVRAQVSPQFFGWLFGLADGVEIVSPLEIRRQFTDYLSSVKAMYCSGEERQA